jgi:hypothetical protein
MVVQSYKSGCLASSVNALAIARNNYTRAVGGERVADR